MRMFKFRKPKWGFDKRYVAPFILSIIGSGLGIYYSLMGLPLWDNILITYGLATAFIIYLLVSGFCTFTE
jgi:hypothetical protein